MSVMSYRYLKLAGMWIRILLLSITLLACATFVLWQFGGAWVDRFDNFVVKTYQGYHQKRLNHAVSTASKSPKEGVVLFEQFLGDLSEIHKLDRLDRVKRTAFEAIVKVLNNADRSEEALAWAERWAEFDNRDLFAQVWRAKLMRKSQSKLEEGWLLISELYQKVPHSSLIVNEYAEYLIGRKEYTSAYLTVYKAFKKQDSLTGQAWQMYWDTGDDFHAVQMKNISPVIDANGMLSFKLDLPPGIIRLRIDPPMNSRINIVNPMLVNNKVDQSRGFTLLDNPLGLSQMIKVGNRLVTTGDNDPYFYWNMAGVKVSVEKLFFVCTVEETPPDVLEKIIRESDFDAVESDLLEQQEQEAAKVFRVLSEKQRSVAISSSFRNAFFEIFWKGPGENYSQQRKVKEAINGAVEKGSYVFDTVFQVASRAEKLRIDFPSVQGTNYTFEKVELVGDGWSHQVDLNKIDDGLSHMVAHQSANFKVLGNDPYFVLSAPSKGRVIESVVIRGRAH